MSWSGVTFLGEVGRSLTSRPFTLVVIVLIFTGTSLATASGDMLSWRNDSRLAAAQEASGSLVIRAGAPDMGGAADSDTAGGADISTTACLALNHTAGVTAAGGVGPSTLAYAATSPGLGFRVLPAVGRIVPALTGLAEASSSTENANEPSLIVSDEVAQQVGLAAGSWSVVDGILVRISTVESLGQRDPELGRVALDMVAPPPALTACYIAFTDTYALQRLSALLPAIFASTPQLQLTRLYATGDGNPDPAQLWTTRSLRGFYLPLGALAALVYLLLMRTRRNEYSIYLVTGSTRVHLAFLILLSGYALTLAGFALTLAWLPLLAHLWHVPGYGFQLGVLAATRTTIVTVALLPLSLTWLLRVNLHRLLRERTS